MYEVSLSKYCRKNRYPRIRGTERRFQNQLQRVFGLSLRRASTAVAWRSVKLIQLKVCGGMTNFMFAAWRKTCRGRSFLFLCRTHRQVFNFCNAVAAPPFMRPAPRRRRLSVSQTRCSHARRVCNINKFAAETCPRRAIPKGSAGATTLSKVQHRCQQADWNFQHTSNFIRWKRKTTIGRVARYFFDIIDYYRNMWFNFPSSVHFFTT